MREASTSSREAALHLGSPVWPRVFPWVARSYQKLDGLIELAQLSSARDETSLRYLIYKQFSAIGQQRDASTAGIWVFIASEIMFFGAFSLAFTVYRLAYIRAVNARMSWT
jgi:hypothetical protein